MTKEKQQLLCEIMAAIINCYDENGNTVDEYYNNVILPDLTPAQYKILKQFAEFDVEK